MQPLKYLLNWLLDNANPDHSLFTSADLRCLFPNLSDGAFNTLLSRAVDAEVLAKICKKIYLFEKYYKNDGYLLFHVAALLRSNHFNYVSLETILSYYGVISQVPMNWISLMSSGRSNIISCQDFGTIEFIHTTQQALKVKDFLDYDQATRLWHAKPQLALRDMKRTNRNLDLINWEILNLSPDLYEKNPLLALKPAQVQIFQGDRAIFYHIQRKHFLYDPLHETIAFQRGYLLILKKSKQ